MDTLGWIFFGFLVFSMVAALIAVIVEDLR